MDAGELFGAATSTLVDLVRARLDDGRVVIQDEKCAGADERAQVDEEFEEAMAAVEELARRAGP
jgi:hypothetical protein